MDRNDVTMSAARSSPDGLSPEDPSYPSSIRLATCHSMLRQVRIIEKTIGKRLATSPELAMLLDLYAAEREARETCLWEVCNATTVPVSTAHRKLTKLIEQGHVMRAGPSRDHRRTALHLAPAILTKLDALMDCLADGKTPGRDA